VAGELWIVTHKDLKETARIRAFLFILGEQIAGLCGLFEGTGATVLPMDAGGRVSQKLGRCIGKVAHPRGPGPTDNVGTPDYNLLCRSIELSELCGSV